MLTCLPDFPQPGLLPLTSTPMSLPIAWIPALRAFSLPLSQPSQFHRRAFAPLLPQHRRLFLPHFGLCSFIPSVSPPPGHLLWTHLPSTRYFISSARNYLTISHSHTPVIIIPILVSSWIPSTCMLPGSNGSTCQSEHNSLCWGRPNHTQMFTLLSLYCYKSLFSFRSCGQTVTKLDVQYSIATQSKALDI